ncbi:hypothetical protein NL487_26740, partial [Klebsiella pneumoniae]|nr:hypothetical protein [Klebsiella pneumoniae]
PVEASVVEPATELPQGQLGASLDETTPQQTLALLVDRFTNIHQISNQVVMQNAQMQRMMNLTSNEISELKKRSNEMSSEHVKDLAAKDA